MGQGDLPSTSVNILCGRETFRQRSSTFHEAGRPFISIPRRRENFHQLPSTFRPSRRPSVNFCEITVRQGNLLSTFVNFPCGREAFRQFSVNFLSGRENFRHLPPRFRLSGRTSIIFCQLSMWPGDLPSTYINFRAVKIPSVNFLCGQETFRQLSV